MAGARRAELASLRWTDEHDGHLLIDSAIKITKRGGDGAPELREAATKTANVRTVTIDADTVEMIDKLRRTREPYGPWMCGLGPELVSPDRISWWWRRAPQMSGIDSKWRLHDLRHWSATVANHRVTPRNPETLSPTIFEGTSEIQQLVIARATSGLRIE